VTVLHAIDQRGFQLASAIDEFGIAGGQAQQRRHLRTERVGEILGSLS